MLLQSLPSLPKRKWRLITLVNKERAIHPTSMIPWAFGHRPKAIAHFSCMMPKHLWFWRVCLVIPLPATGVPTSWLRVCRANIACINVWVGGWKQEGERRAILQYRYHLCGITTAEEEQKCDVHISHWRCCTVEIYSTLDWVKTRIFATWKIKLLWLGNSLLTMKHTEEGTSCLFGYVQDKNIQLLNCIQVSFCSYTNTKSSNLFTFLSAWVCTMQVIEKITEFDLTLAEKFKNSFRIHSNCILHYCPDA